MQIQISGRHVDLGESFQSHVEKRLTDGLSKYLDRITSSALISMAIPARTALW